MLVKEMVRACAGAVLVRSPAPVATAVAAEVAASLRKFRRETFPGTSNVCGTHLFEPPLRLRWEFCAYFHGAADNAS